jgi:hypothetical protein
VRQALGNNKTALTQAVNGQVTNVDEINFPAATAPFGTVAAVGIFDSLTAGNLLFVSVQSTAKPFDEGDVAFFEPGDVSWIVQNILD